MFYFLNHIMSIENTQETLEKLKKEKYWHFPINRGKLDLPSPDDFSKDLQEIKKQWKRLE